MNGFILVYGWPEELLDRHQRHRRLPSLLVIIVAIKLPEEERPPARP